MRLIILSVIIVDSVDNVFDINRWLLDIHGFIPLLTPITEPAVGYSRTVTDLRSSGNGSSAWNAGSGFRYLVARHLGLQMGIDVSRGPENGAFYIIFGSSWLK